MQTTRRSKDDDHVIPDFGKRGRRCGYSKQIQLKQEYSPRFSLRLLEKGHRDVDAGQGTLPLGKVLLVAYLVESSIRVQEQSATRHFRC